MQDRIHGFVTIAIIPVALWIVSEYFRSATAEADDAPGITQRIPWTTSRIVGSPDPSSAYRIENVFPHLHFEKPTVLTMAPGSTRWFIAELAGRIYSFPNDPGIRQADVDLFIDLTEYINDVQHVYGMTFHPNFERNGYVYISYLQGEGFSGHDYVSRFKVKGDSPPRVDPGSELLLLKWPTSGHNGCCLKFGPDRFLYISTGDGAAPSPPDPYDTGQDIGDLKSSILRIDVDRTEGSRPYAIPDGNPFVDQPNARPEVWAYGFRNPWKMSFDSATSDLWVGDVGWDMWEMVFRVEPGGNYGWSIVEGGQTIRTDLEPGPTPIQLPILIHPRSEFRSITGGFVYHGKSCPDIQGAYLYGDYVTGELWGLRYNGGQVTWKQKLVNAQIPIIAFAEDHDGELYVVDYGQNRPGDQNSGGSIYRLVPDNTRAANLDFPRTLSETGLFTSVPDQQLAPGVISYSITAEPWADGAGSTRAVAIPNRESVEVHHQENLLLGYRQGTLNFPDNSVLVKTLSLELAADKFTKSQPVETQILHRNEDEWRAYTYIWNDEGTDAILAPAGGTERVYFVRDSSMPGGSRLQTWHFCGRSECIVCHSPRAGSVLGFNAAQLDCDHRYGEIVSSQLATMSHVNLFSEPPPAGSDSLVSPADSGFTLDRRVRSWLDVNCAHCHGNGGGGTAQFRLRYSLPLDQTGMLSGRLTQGSFGIPMPRIVVAGDPYRSVLYYRMAKLGKGRMPHLGSRFLDRSGLQLIHDWIRGLPPSSDDALPLNSDLTSIRATRRRDLQKLTAGGGTDEVALDALLHEPDGALMVQHKVLSEEFSPEIRQQIVRYATASSNPHVSELFLDFLPEEARPEEIRINPAHVLGLQGDVAHGRQLFLTDSRLLCRNCHRVQNDGTAVGPDLTQIGRKYEPRELLDSLLFPSRKIEPAYVPWLLLTKAGLVYTGFLVERAAGERVVLKDGEGKIISVPSDDIEEMIAQDKSLMPDDALRSVSPENVADLLAWLSSLK